MFEDAQNTDVSESIIGQFGVGFYSAFIVADKVTARFGGRAVVVSVYEDGEVGAVIRRG